MLTMAILDQLGPDQRIETRAAAGSFDHGEVSGPLWILGGGDPGINSARIGTLAHDLVDAGLTRVEGSVRGSTTFFKHDWFAKGWKRDFPQTECALPSALTFNNNSVNGRHINDPEKLAAQALTKKLRGLGVHITQSAGAGAAPSGLADIASIHSKPITSVLHRQNVDSVNFYAEVLGKLLGAETAGAPGTIRKGAAAIEDFASTAGAHVDAFDSSGLSYDDRVSTRGMLKMLDTVDAKPWAGDLRGTLAKSGQGTLAGRLHGLDVRAKTGTLDNISALSGWVRLDSDGNLAEFSILSRGMSKTTAINLEDKIVALIAHNA
jgi:D-alanyl-D-alanine carboxypeptidase/D-alanyl-D-alanine-endopeptidase (penicillin-binding protein 4)